MILTVNAGSSSIKFMLFNVLKNGKFELIVKGLLERIKVKDSIFSYTKTGKKKVVIKKDFANHDVGAKYLINFFLEKQIIKDYDEILGIGFRVVNGGEYFLQSHIINSKVMNILKSNINLAPLHNLPAINTIKAFQKVIAAPKVVVCDTSFHSTMPKSNFLYATPYEWYTDHQVRRYGMHGISYRYITKKLAKILNKKPSKINAIICHLGNGASLCAVKNGESMISSMGLTPLEGLMMGTRSGDLDPAISEYVCNKLNISVHEFVDILNKKSGWLGVSGVSSDARDVEIAASKGNERAQLAIEMFVKRVGKYISIYQNEVEKDFDGIVFTGGIGENSALIRKKVVEYLKTLDLKINDDLNTKSYDDFKLISTSESEVPVYAIHTDEEIVMCQDVYDLVVKNK